MYFCRAQELGDALVRDPLGRLRLALGHQHRDRADDVGDLALQVADARLARVAVDHLGDRGVVERPAARSSGRAPRAASARGTASRSMSFSSRV